MDDVFRVGARGVDDVASMTARYGDDVAAPMTFTFADGALSSPPRMGGVSIPSLQLGRDLRTSFVFSPDDAPIPYRSRSFGAADDAFHSHDGYNLGADVSLELLQSGLDSLPLDGPSFDDRSDGLHLGAGSHSTWGMDSPQLGPEEFDAHSAARPAFEGVLVPRLSLPWFDSN